VLAKSDAQIAMHIEESPHTSLGYLITIDPQGTPGVMLELCPGGVRKEDNKCQLLAKSDVIVIQIDLGKFVKIDIFIVYHHGAPKKWQRMGAFHHTARAKCSHDAPHCGV
jgi:hypothetical protein